MVAPSDLCKRLRDYIEDKENRERECRWFLQYAKDLLFRGEFPIEYRCVETEYRTHSGDSDYVISGLVCDQSSVECVRVYIWEAKAPQCHIFVKDTKNRLRPSKELVQAENQLLHYYLEQKNSIEFLDEFGVTHPDDVCLGGIIIGSRKTRVGGGYSDAKRTALYRKAMRTRRILYGDKIRLITWDRVLEHICPTRD